MSNPNPSDPSQRPVGEPLPSQPTDDAGIVVPRPTAGEATPVFPSGAKATPGPRAANPRPTPADQGSSDDKSAAAREAQEVAGRTGDRAKDVAGTTKEEASAVAETAKREGGQVLDRAKEEASHVVDEAKRHTRDLLDTGAGEFRQQAQVGKQWVAELARSFSGELEGMTRNVDDSGPVAELALRAQRLGGDAADWLDRHDPQDILEAIRRYAARKPWTFLAISAAVGFVGARLVRALRSDDDSDTGPTYETRSSFYSSGQTARRAGGTPSEGPSGFATHYGQTGTGEPLDAPSYTDDVDRLAEERQGYTADLHTEEIRRSAPNSDGGEPMTPGSTGNEELR